MAKDYRIEGGKAYVCVETGAKVAVLRDGVLEWQPGCMGHHKKPLAAWMRKQGQAAPPALPDISTAPFDRMAGMATPGLKAWLEEHCGGDAALMRAVVRRLETRK